ncbi:hypothetical protein HERIO_178 [Hepatospora eriocheir]|uniref:Type 1 phosphatases regulator n=1 Tax=Hepatospora eriocheir TaxID=1081669 RepID=A0A1X0QDX5_9MICR|nr:hypothetical protein HERIO_178 [Hepatospora eriocheir]
MERRRTNLCFRNSSRRTIKTLKLVRRKKVTWSSSTVDNSKLNKKSSKCCCIVHNDGIDVPSEKNKYERT